MTRRISIAGAGPTVDTIWDYYEFSRGLMQSAYRSALRGEPAGSFLLPANMRGLSLKDAFREIVAELEDEVTLALSSAFEARLRVDFLQRVGDKRKDAVSRRLRDVYKAYKNHFRLEDLLDIWRDEGDIPKSHISAAKQLLYYRNWLAHGRYWTFCSRKYDPEEALSVTEGVLNEIDRF